MQGEFLAVALCDHAGAGHVGKLVMASLAGHDALVQGIRTEDDLNELADAAAAFEPDAELLADSAGPAVAACEVAAAQRPLVAVDGAGVNRHAALVLVEVDQFAAVAHGDIGRPLGHFLQQRLELVLRDQLIRLEQPGAVGQLGDLLATLRHGRVFQDRDRRIAEAGGQKHIHRVVGWIAQCAHPIDDADAAIELHRACIRAVHLRPRQGGRVTLHEQAPDAAPAEIDGERQPDRTGTRDDHVDRPRVGNPTTRCQAGGAIRKTFDELKIQVSTKPVTFGLRSSALSAPVRHIQLRISCCPLFSTACVV